MTEKLKMVQCIAIIRNGSQCSKNARVKNFNGYCDGHQKLAGVVSDNVSVTSEGSTSSSTSDGFHNIPLPKFNLFEKLFDLDDGYIKDVENISKLKYKNFNELFDYNKLAFILNNINDIEDLYREDARNMVALDKYFANAELYKSKDHKGLRTGLLSCKYEQADTGLYGRYQAIGSLSGQGMVREVRHTIFSDYYVDIDMDNCHPVITKWICGNLDIKCDFLTEYIENRESIFNELMEMNAGKTREHFKKAFLKMSYGCGDNSYEKDFPNKSEFVSNFRSEIKNIQSIICSKLYKFKQINIERRKAAGKEYNYRGSTLSHICQFVENQLLIMVYNELSKYIDNIDMADSILCFDGIMVKKSVFKEEYLNYCKTMFKSVGINMNMSIKKMTPINLYGMGYKDDIKYSYTGDVNVRDRIINEICNELSLMDRNEIYDNNKVEFGKILKKIEKEDIFPAKDIAKLLNQTTRIILNNGSPTIYIKEYVEYSVLQGDGSYSDVIVQSIIPTKIEKEYFTIFISHKKSVEKFFLEDLIKSVKKFITYVRVTLEPYGAKEINREEAKGYLNIFPGFMHKYDENFNVDMSIVNVWLDHIKLVLCDNNEEIYNYLLKYFTNLLLHPCKKSGALLIIKGNQGSGKNSAFDVFNKFVIGDSIAKTVCNMEQITGRFNGMRQSLIMTVLDEAVDNKNKAAMNAFKSLITSDFVTIEHKGKEAFQVRDFNNYVILTNNDFSSFIEESDRRSLCLLTNDSLIGKHDYFNNYYNTLSSVDAGKHIFHYLIKNICVPSGWNAQQMPDTKYKRDLKQVQACSVIKFYLNEYDNLADSDEKTINISPTVLYNKYKEFCDNNKYKILGSIIFAKISKLHCDSYQCGGGSRYKTYSYESLKKSLSAYL